MTIQKNSSNITETFIIEEPAGLSGTCSPIYTNMIEPCLGQTEIGVNGDIIIYGNLSATTISATTYVGLPTDIWVTGGTYNSGTVTFTNNTGGTFNVTGLTTPFTGGTIVGGLVTPSVSATTYIGDGSNLTGINNAINGQFVHLSGDTMSGNLNVNYNTDPSSSNRYGVRTVLVQTGTSAVNSSMGFSTNVTYSGTGSTRALKGSSNFVRNQNSGTLIYGYGSVSSVFNDGDGRITNLVGCVGSATNTTTGSFNKLLGGQFVATNNSTNPSNYDMYGLTSNVFNTGSMTGGALGLGVFFDSNTGVVPYAIGMQIQMEYDTSSLVGDVRGISIGTDAHAFSGITPNLYGLYIHSSVTGGTVNNYSIYNNSVAPSYFAGNISTVGFISATTYYGLPTDVLVTGGTYSNGTTTFTNNTGGTFTISGFTTPFTGGTIAGDLVLPSVSATTISATTYYGDGSNLSGLVTANDYTTGVTLNNDILYFNRTNGLSAYTVDLSYFDNTSGVSYNTLAISGHTGDTSIHYQLSAITLSNIGNSAHTHSISGVTGLQTSLDDKTDLILFTGHTGNTNNPHNVTTSQISAATQSDFILHTGDTTIHFTKESLDDMFVNVSGDTMTGTLYGTVISANTISATTYYGDGSNLTGINNAINGQFVHLSGDTMTGNLVVPTLSATTIDIFNQIINSSSGDILLNDNVKITGDLIVLGSTITANTQQLLIKDNTLTLNYGETGGTVTKGVAGLEIDRGTGDTYTILFQESDDTFRVGVTGNTQVVATREDNPISNGVAIWNPLEYRFDTTLDLSATTISATTYYGNGSNLTGINIAHSATTGILGNGEYHLSGPEYSQVSGTVLSNTYASIINLTAHTDDTTIHFTKNSINLSDLGSSAHTHSISGVTNLQTELNNKAYLSGATYTGIVYSSGISANTISATTYVGLPIDVRVTGGTYNDGTATFTNNTGGTFTVSGFNTSKATVFTGGTVTGATIFTNGITANTLNINGIQITGDTYVTGGTYNNGTLTLNQQNNNIIISGFSTSTATAFTGGTVTGNTVFTNGITATTDITINSLSGSTTREVKINSNGTLIASDDKVILTGITGTSIIDIFSNTVGDASIWDYIVKSTIGLRAGTITGVWSGNTAEYYEISTNDIGNTHGTNLSVDVIGGNVRLIANITGGTWTIKTNRTIL